MVANDREVLGLFALSLAAEHRLLRQAQSRSMSVDSGSFSITESPGSSADSLSQLESDYAAHLLPDEALTADEKAAATALSPAKLVIGLICLQSDIFIFVEFILIEYIFFFRKKCFFRLQELLLFVLLFMIAKACCVKLCCTTIRR